MTTTTTKMAEKAEITPPSAGGYTAMARHIISLPRFIIILLLSVSILDKQGLSVVDAWSLIPQQTHQQQHLRHRALIPNTKQPSTLSSSDKKHLFVSTPSCHRISSLSESKRNNEGRARYPHRFPQSHPHRQGLSVDPTTSLSFSSSCQSQTTTSTTLTSSSLLSTTKSSETSNKDGKHDSDSSRRNPDDFPSLLLYNSKSRTKDAFRPLSASLDGDDRNKKKNHVSMYTCGPTVYDYAHVGNFRAFLTYDLIKRVLIYLGYDVTHICNLTDIDDKIITRANEQNIPQGQIFTELLTKKYEQYFFDDLAALNVIMADRYPRATEHITEMMDMILALESNGLAYEASDGSWYFATTAKDGYGQQLVQLNRDEMEMTEDTDDKRDPQDFALWKAFKPGVDRDDASWESDRFKKGRPGWHLECSAMARKYLGDTIDIHGGGIDLKFPHHENEIAQSEGVTGQTFCNCWLHNGFVNINDEKMSKSLGNFLTLRTACPTSQDVRAYRYLVMSSQYSKQLNFTPDAMKASKSALKRIDKVMDQVSDLLSKQTDNDGEDSDLATTVVPKALSNFEAALLDDMSMPRASASLFSLVKAAEKELKRIAKDDTATPDRVGLTAVVDAMRQMDEVFGIFYEVPLTEEEQKALEGTDSNEDATTTVPSEVMELVLQRSEAKEAKDWELADSLRARIAELGFAVKDVKGGEPEVTKVQ